MTNIHNLQYNYDTWHSYILTETTLLPGRRKSREKRRKHEYLDLPDGSGWGDHIQLLQIYECWHQTDYDIDWCKDYQLIGHIEEQLEGNLSDLPKKVDVAAVPDDRESIIQAARKRLRALLVTQANDVEASKKLIEGADVDLNEQDEKGYSAAMISAEGGYLESFKLLINAGADINLQNKRGQTVLDSPVEFYGTLHQAVQHSATDFVHTLRSRGSDVLLMPMDTLR
ncbi:hypothetical protein ACFX13_021708 [Malus domestica]